MRNPKKKTYENWSRTSLTSAFMEKFGDLYCFVWDLGKPGYSDHAAIAGARRSMAGCMDILKEVKLRQSDAGI